MSESQPNNDIENQEQHGQTSDPNAVPVASDAQEQPNGPDQGQAGAGSAESAEAGTSDFAHYGLSEEILRSLDTLGYKNPTPVQQQVIPQALAGKDVTVKSQTGSGKTAAYGIPLCELLQWEESRPQALILTPTRELADQVKEDMMNIGRFKRIKAAAIYGKQPFDRQKRELMQRNHVVVGTPGRVMDHIEKDTIDLERIQYLIIDEADEMLSMGFIEQLEKIIKQLPKERVTMLFSATLPKDVESLCHRYMRSPVDIEIGSASDKRQTQIQHKLYTVGEKAKAALLHKVTVTENPDSCIIFCRTQANVDAVSAQLDRLGYPSSKIHGGMEQDDRNRVMNEFRAGQFRYLVATDVAARGIDIDRITHVINYDLPMEKESYVHRTGRTGRAGQSGTAITFVTPFEDKFLASIERYIGFELPRFEEPSAHMVAEAQAAFDRKLRDRPAAKKSRGEELNANIMKLYFNGGKKKKLRNVDFVGTIARIEGVTADDIGIISIQETVTYVDILNGKGNLVLKAMQETTIKGKQLKVQKART
ncbi:DEAD/DEAH box helicase [Saccharibacillus brassicae]|uniref:ATP-dependent RNA helicase DbpA n=1 Tax=Saccharibacillus brassicae TaxID=2583377 RepID=A0A4Y6UZL9_SACBS|nr:DEAD/DEAH box helicase [Saccharibacillus brassicae]QDH21978.1 DEAD/DEAH box helicase [Saccharibacillus brassicae]